MVILWAVRVRRGPNSLLAGYSSGRGIGIGGGSRTLSNMGLSHARLPVAPRRCVVPATGLEPVVPALWERCLTQVGSAGDGNGGGI